MIAKFFLVLINKWYEINDIIQNPEMMMYQVFMSPLANKEEWKAAEKNGDFLTHNLFKASLSANGYISLLKSL